MIDLEGVEKRKSNESKYFSELGSTGITRFGGQIYEEFIPKLAMPHCLKVYDEMSSNDPTVGAVLFAEEQLIKKVSWNVVAGGNKRIDLKLKQFVEECKNDMSMTWGETIDDILTNVIYGFSWHEIVYKLRGGQIPNPLRKSRYNDNLIGWKKIPIRSQTSWQSWIFEPDGDSVLGFEQNAPPKYESVIIPIQKSLLFKTRSNKGNPEGKSLLRNAYRPWYFKKHIEEIEGIGIERDLAGLPVLQPPENTDIWNTHDEEAVKLRATAQNLVTNIRRDKNEGIVLPFGWELSLLSTGSRRNFDTNAIINRYDQRIAITMLADLIMLGADKVGSFALADVKRSMLGAALESITNRIADVFNKYAIPRLIELNNFKGYTEYPKLVPGRVDTPNLRELMEYIDKLADLGLKLFPNNSLEQYLFSLAGLPDESNDDSVYDEKYDSKIHRPKETTDEDDGKSKYKDKRETDNKEKYNEVYREHDIKK